MTIESLHSKRSGASRPASRIEERLADEARFFKSWLDNPILTGAVSPSGRFLARTMAHYVDPKAAGPIIELGPGTGPITEALLQRGVAAERLFLVEYDGDFCKLLRQRFPGVHIVQGDAYRLAQTLGDLLEEPAAAVVSSLPLLNKPERQRLALLEDAFHCMAPEGCFIQFTYGMLSPIPRHLAGSRFESQVSAPVWLNLPPARVWVYRRATLGAAARPAKVLDFLDKLKAGTGKIQLDLKREIEAAKARLNLHAGRVNPRGGLKLDPALRMLRKLPHSNKSRGP
ncbi:MAG TPA: ribose ABC transporter permease [Beijerinckia sp.]|nr:ribose ABC transporter permease [Beijerinckia sp.]